MPKQAITYVDFCLLEIENDVNFDCYARVIGGGAIILDNIK
jgi:hypothetical protein